MPRVSPRIIRLAVSELPRALQARNRRGLVGFTTFPKGNVRVVINAAERRMGVDAAAKRHPAELPGFPLDWTPNDPTGHGFA